MKRALALAGLGWSMAAAAITPSAEISFEAPAYQRLPTDVDSIRIAHGGGVSLVVWSDPRRGLTSAAYGTGPDVYATRLDAAGNVLDPAGIPVCAAAHSQINPVVAWDGSAFVIAWQDYRDNSHYVIWAARIAPDGTVLTPADGMLVSDVGTSQNGWDERPSIASDGTTTWIAWQRSFGLTAYNILGARLSSSGVLLDPTPRVLSNANRNQMGPVIAAGPAGTFFVAWSDERNSGTGTELDIYGARVASDGTVLDAAGLAVNALAPSAQTAPAVVFDGTHWVVTWIDYRDGRSGNDLFAARVRASDGVVLEPDGVRLTSQGAYKRWHSSAFDGANTWSIWEESYNQALYGARFSPAGAVVDSPALPLFPSQAQKGTGSLSSTGGTLWAAWTEYDGLFGGRAGRFERDGGLVDPDGRFVAWGSNKQVAPVLATLGSSSLLVWSDTLPDPLNGTLRMRRLDATGAPVGGVTVLTSSAGRRAVAASAGAYLVAWEYAGGEIRAVRVRPDGTLIDATPFLVAYGTGPTSIASDGTNWLVTWQVGILSGKTYGTLVRANGTVTSPIPLSSATGAQLEASAAFGGNQYLVAWTDSRNGTSNQDIYANRLTATGLVLDGDGFPVSRATSVQREANVAFHDDFLVTWSDYRTGGFYGEIRSSRVHPDGGVVDPSGLVIASGFGTRARPRAVFDGSAFLIGWDDGPDAFRKLELNRLTVDGQVMFPSAVELWRSADSTGPLDLQRIANHSVLAVYARFDGAPGVFMDRVHGRVIAVDPLTPPDAGQPDAGMPDSGVPDSGVPDSGVPDSGVADSGVPDSGTPDAGMPDAGPPDSGTSDAGTSDGGVTQPPPDPPGCGCSTGGTSLTVLLGLALLVTRRQRRRRA